MIAYCIVANAALKSKVKLAAPVSVATTAALGSKPSAVSKNDDSGLVMVQSMYSIGVTS
jgi:hypothetical protein